MIKSAQLSVMQGLGRRVAPVLARGAKLVGKGDWAERLQQAHAIGTEIRDVSRLEQAIPGLSKIPAGGKVEGVFARIPGESSKVTFRQPESPTAAEAPWDSIPGSVRDQFIAENAKSVPYGGLKRDLAESPEVAALLRRLGMGTAVTGGIGAAGLGTGIALSRRQEKPKTWYEKLLEKISSDRGYGQGFVDACTRKGVDAAALLKAAADSYDK